MTELHNSHMEKMIESLVDRIEHTNRILHGDPDIGLGVLARLADLENKHNLMMQQVASLTDAIQADREQRKHEQEIQAAVEKARTETIQKLLTLVKVFGPVLGGGLGINIILELLKFLGTS